MNLDILTFAQLSYNPAINARGTTKTDLTETAATIAARGFGQPLLVRPSPEEAGIFEPVDGGRRYHAVGLLIEQGKVPEDFPIPVLIRELSDTEALELSLVTAVTRVPLNAADEAVSFARLVDDGMTAENLAAHFGVPLRRVHQRLAIAQLPKMIIEALRADQIGLDVAEAYTVGSDAKQVEKLFNNTGQASPHYIRSQLMAKRVPAFSREAKFVGLDTYRAAGGHIDEDLFSTNAWLSDGKLLARLFAAAVQNKKDELLGQGWQFVEVDDQAYSGKTSGWPRLEPEGKPSLSKEQKARAAELKANIKNLQKLIDQDRGDADQHEAGLELIEAELKTLTGAHFTEAQKAKSGAVIAYGHDDIDIRLGVVKPSQARETKKSKQTAAAESSVGGAPQASDAEADFTQALAVEMAAAMTHAMQLAIAKNPAMASRALCATLLTLVDGTAPHPFKIAAAQHFSRPCEQLSNDLKVACEPFISDVPPGSLPALFQHLTSFTPDVIEHLTALALASLFNFTHSISADAGPLIDAFDPDIGAVWQPGEEFFRHMPRASLAAALGEAAVPGVSPSKKKKELVEMCLAHLVPLGWLPKPLRTPSYKGPGGNAFADAKSEQLADEARLQQAAE